MKTYNEEYFNDYEDELEKITCPYCKKRGYRVLLGPKILKPNEPRPEDYENWLECPRCYNLVPIHEIPKEEEIKDSIETIDNPFESGKFILESVKKRTSKTMSKRSRKKIELHEDPEINELMRIYGDRVKVVYDTNP